MDVSKSVVTAFAIIVLLIVFITVINFFIPFFMKIELNNIGREYRDIMEVESGLTAQDKTEIEALLVGKGFKNISITCTLKGTAVFGQKMILDIQTEYPIYEFSSFEAFKINIPINYKREVFSRRIEE